MTDTTPRRITVRAAGDRGHVDFGWLKSAHTFSFGGYRNPDWVQFGPLRVINDDRVSAGQGFGMHSHQDAEIFSYVLEGALSHQDSMGNGSTVEAGGVQYMSAGSGVSHSEFNPSESDDARFLQIWLLPAETGGDPRYDTMDIPAEDKAGKLTLFLSPDGQDGSMASRAHARVYSATLNADQRIVHELADIPKAWIQVARGDLNVNGVVIRQGDGVAIEGGGPLVLSDGHDAELLLFELL